MPKVNASFPDRIGDYTFRSVLHPKQQYHRFEIAEYESATGARAIAKRWTGSKFHLNYARFMNEVHFYEALASLPSAHAEELAMLFPRMHTPHFIQAYGTQDDLILLIEKIKGNPISSVVPSERIALYEEALAYVKQLGAFLSNTLRLRPYYALYQTFRFPIIMFRALWRSPKDWKRILAMSWFFARHIPALIMDRRVQFVHRDLWPNNILIAEDASVTLIDFDVIAIMHPFVDVLKLSLGLWNDAPAREAWKQSRTIRSIFDNAHDASVFRALGCYTALFELSMPQGDRALALSFEDFLSSPYHRETQEKPDLKASGRPTVTIGIPAYNEESSINFLIGSLLAQQERTYTLEKIIVFSDGSTDGTVEKACATADPRVYVHVGKVRRGKPYRMNQLFEMSTSDIAIVLDADIALENETCIEALVEPFRAYADIALVSGSSVPAEAASYVQKIAAAGVSVWDATRAMARPNDLYYCEGAIRAFSRSLYTKMRFPERSADDVFPYLYAQKHGFRFMRADAAKVQFTLPATLRDYLSQMKRFSRSYTVHKDNFDGLFVKHYYTVTLPVKVKAILKECIRNPFFTLNYFAMWCVIRVWFMFEKEADTSLWDIAESTKVSRKKIIFSSYDDLHNPYYAGGGAIAVHQVAKRLALESDITILTGKYPGSVDTVLDGVHYRRVGSSLFGPKVGQLIFMLALPWHVMRMHFDVWIESFTPPFSTACLQLFTRKQVIGLVHMLAGEDMYRKYHIPFHLLERLGLKTYNRFIVLTQVTADAIRRSNPKAVIDVINNGVDFPKENQTAQVKEYISFIGRIEVNQKGLDLLLKAYAHVADKLPYKLAIAGTGADEELSKLHALIGELGLEGKVRLFGRVSGPEKNDVFSKSVFTVLPSRHETFSLVALETLSYSLPLLAFDIEGLKWLPDYCCMKIPPFQYERLGERMLELATHPELRTKLALQGHAYISNFSWEDVSYKYRESISEALDAI